MTIPNEVVEAAARAGYNEIRALMGFPHDHDSAPKGTREAYALFARAALKAAAPLMLAEAWDSGNASGWSNAMRRMSDEPGAPKTPNPYRAQQ